MKRKLLFFFGCMFLGTVSSFGYNLGFGNMFSGARIGGMGDAFVAIADDANAMFFNPAGLALQKQNSMTAGNLYLEDMGDVSAIYFGSVFVSKELVLGMGYSKLGLSGLVNEDVACATFASKIGGEALSIGMNVKRLSLSFSFYGSGFTGSAMSADIGMLCRAGILSLGIVVADFMKPKMKMTYGEAQVMSTQRIGIGMSSGGFNLGIDYQGYSDSDISLINLGLEYMMEKGIGIRAGTSKTAGDPYVNTTVTAGISIRLPLLELHYCTLMPYIDDVIYTEDSLDYVSLAFRFGGAKPQEQEQERDQDQDQDRERYYDYYEDYY